MADNRTMAQLLQAPTEGYEDAIVIPEISANFELKHPLMATFIKTTFKSTFHKLLQPILIKEIPILDLRWFQTKSDLLVFLRFKTIKTVSIQIKEIISTKIEVPIQSNRGNNFNQGQVYQPSKIQPPVYQAPPQQMQGVSKTDFENYVKANDAVLWNMQNQGQGPSTPLVPTPVVSTPLKEPEQNPKTSMDKVKKRSSENTAQVPLPEEEDSIFIENPANQKAKENR
ncbi:hypothetical protein Tco_0799947 [Tanacetum coccineum]|uniref:Reverse transcriptase domain-containing protein n=1 Tax=Tanacetum coccineum TaxID=301880 RepID=A0ABQ4ZRR0_9ASTR